VDRRSRLQAASAGGAAAVADLLLAVDSALERLDTGVYGACCRCDGHVEADRLVVDPLATVCLECLSDDEKQALQRDLELASSVQATLLPPRDFACGEWLGHYSYRPLGTVGGDYVDVLRPQGPEGDVVVLLGDVSGKGVAAAMLMSHLHAGVRALAGTECCLAALVEGANRLLHGASAANLYATLAAVRLGTDGVAEVVTAGHLPVLVVHNREVAPLRTEGLPVGLFASASYSSSRVQLERGDALVLYTDGVTEATSRGGEELGVEGLVNALATTTDHSPRSLVASVIAAAENHHTGAVAHDDLSAAVIQRRAS
jgi:sigma-B regulation protein RsbU (phosphoserine phosphatase)